MKSKIKIGLITSKGGHLFELQRLNFLWNKYDRFWVTFAGKDLNLSIKKEKIYYAYYPESRNLLNFIRNIFLSIKILIIERPNVLVSCGAGIAVPFFLIGKLIFNIKLIFIEEYNFIDYPTMTGKIVYNFVDLFIVQHKLQKKWYPKAKYWGSLW